MQHSWRCCVTFWFIFGFSDLLFGLRGVPGVQKGGLGGQNGPKRGVWGPKMGHFGPQGGRTKYMVIRAGNSEMQKVNGHFSYTFWGFGVKNGVFGLNLGFFAVFGRFWVKKGYLFSGQGVFSCFFMFFYKYL